MSFTYSNPNINVNNANLVIVGAGNKLRTPKVEFSDGTFLTSGLGVTNNLELISSIGNVTSNTLQFVNPRTAFITAANSNVGIGLNDPDRLLHVGSRTTGGQIRLSTYAPNGSGLSSNYSVLSVTGARTDLDGTIGPVQSGDYLGQVALVGSYDNGYNEGFQIRSEAKNDWTSVPGRVCETVFNQRIGDGVTNSSLSEIMKIDSRGYVGIGTSTPSSTVHIKSNATNTALTLEDAAGANGNTVVTFLSSQHGVGRGANVNLIFQEIPSGFGNCFSIRRVGSESGKINISMDDNTTNILNIKNSNVGVGTLSPFTRLHVSGTTDNNSGECTLRIEDTDPTVDSIKPKLEFYGSGSSVYNISGDSQQSNERFLLFSDRNDSPVMALNFDKDLIKVDGALPEDLGLYNEGMQIRATSLSACKFSINCYDSTNGVGISNVGGIVFRRLPTGTVNDQNSIDLLDGGGVSYFDYIYSISGSVARRGMISTFRDGSGIKHLFNTTEPGNNCFVLRSSGKVGIGGEPTNSYEGLSIQGSNPSIRFNSTSESAWNFIEYSNVNNGIEFSSGVNHSGSSEYWAVCRNSGTANLDTRDFIINSAGRVSIKGKANGYTTYADGDTSALVIGRSSDGLHLDNVNGVNSLPTGAGVFADFNDFGSLMLKSRTQYNNYNIRFYTSSTANGDSGPQERMRITQTGQVTLGSVASGTDTSRLTIKQSGISSTDGIYIERGSERKGYFIYMSGNQDSLTFRRNNAGTQSDVMSLTREGQVWIGDNGGSVGSNTGWVLNGTGGGGTAINFSGTNEIFTFNQINTGATSQVDFRVADVEKGRIEFTNSGTTYNTVSDYRLKENVVELTECVNKVSMLSPKSFNFISNPENTLIGFIAHEVQEVIPQAVTGKKDDIKEDGRPRYQGIDQSMIVPLLVGAIKELKAEIELLKVHCHLV